MMTKTAAIANMPAEPIASTTCTASGQPGAAISRGDGRLPVPAASSAASPSSTAAIARNLGANTASRPPAPSRDPHQRRAVGEPERRFAEWPERVGKPGGMRDERRNGEIEGWFVEGRARRRAPGRVQGRGRRDEIQEDDEKSAQRPATPQTRRIIVQGPGEGALPGPYNPRRHDIAASPPGLLPMFDSLTDRLGKAVDSLRGRGRLTEENIADTLRQVRMALLEADVAVAVVKSFTDAARARAVGTEVMRSLTPGQAFIRVIHEELTRVMGEGGRGLNLHAPPPVVILLAGLQGAGKTTSAAKLARHLITQHRRKPLLVSTDIYRPPQ